LGGGNLARGSHLFCPSVAPQAQDDPSSMTRSAGRTHSGGKNLSNSPTRRATLTHYRVSGEGAHMATGLRGVIEHLHQAGESQTDSQLLGRFGAARDEASFAALVRRHGPVGLGVCRRVLRDHHHAEDAFQATFLVLARKAASVVKRESVGCWLYGVAYRTAQEAGSVLARRRARERPMRDVPHPEAAPAEAQDW